jgi:pimeloyl-ACP methyl ester carboxylesterase
VIPRETVVHSSASSARQWDALDTALGERYRVHAIDLHGHGDLPSWDGPAELLLAGDAQFALAR